MAQLNMILKQEKNYPFIKSTCPSYLGLQVYNDIEMKKV